MRWSRIYQHFLMSTLRTWEQQAGFKFLLSTYLHLTVRILKCIKTLFQLRKRAFDEDIVIIQQCIGIKWPFYQITLAAGKRQTWNGRILWNNHLPFPQNTFNHVKIRGILKDLSYYEQIRFLEECHRILQLSGKVSFTVLDADPMLQVFTHECEHFWKQRYWWTLPNPNTPIGAIGMYAQCGGLFNADTIFALLKEAGFEQVSLRRMIGGNACVFPSPIIQCHAIKQNNKIQPFLPQKKGGQSLPSIPIYLGLGDSIKIAERVELFSRPLLLKRDFYGIIGSFFFLNLIPLLQPCKLIVFDINEYQVRFFKVVQKIISACSSPTEFIERYFSRPFQEDHAEFLQQACDQTILERTRSLAGDQEIFNMTIEKIATARAVSLENGCSALEIPDNPCCAYLTVSDSELFMPGPGVSGIYTKKGFLASQKRFEMVRQLMSDAEILHCSIIDMTLLKRLSVTPSIIYVSNIWSDDWLHKRDADRQLQQALINDQGKTATFFTDMWKDNIGIGQRVMETISSNPYFIDSVGNMFSLQEMKTFQMNAHSWLWAEVNKKLFGHVIEVIHLQEGEWGFHQHLKTINYHHFLMMSDDDLGMIDVIVLHILLGNGVSQDDFTKCLQKAVMFAKRILILEHDVDSPSFAGEEVRHLPDIRTIMQLIRHVPELSVAKIMVEWTGNSVDDEQPNTYRNMLITCDL